MVNIKKIQYIAEDFTVEVESNSEQGVVHVVVREFKNTTNDVGEVESVEKNAVGVVLLAEELKEICLVIEEALDHQERTGAVYK
jgi:hypothetical protein